MALVAAVSCTILVLSSSKSDLVVPPFPVDGGSPKLEIDQVCDSRNGASKSAPLRRDWSPAPPSRITTERSSVVNSPLGFRDPLAPLITRASFSALANGIGVGGASVVK